MAAMTARQAHLLCLLVAAIWGVSFVGQEAAMQHLGPLGFNGMRFALGAAAVLPVALRRHPGKFTEAIVPGMLMGAVLWAGATLQQAGIVDADTGAGDAGFITGMYVVLVPILGLLFGKRTRGWVWGGAGLAVVGLYLLSVEEGLVIGWGDALVLAAAFCWAIHILLIDRFTADREPLHLAAVQFAVCALVSLIAIPIIGESFTRAQIEDAWLPIVYCGLLATGVAFSLQVVAQKYAHPSTAGVLLSGEVVFAAVGGWLLLGERLGGRAWLGGALMLAGMILAQRPWNRS